MENEKNNVKGFFKRFGVRNLVILCAILIIGGAALFFVYDWMMVRFQGSINYLVRRLKL